MNKPTNWTGWDIAGLFAIFLLLLFVYWGVVGWMVSVVSGYYGFNITWTEGIATAVTISLLMGARFNFRK